MSSFSDYYLLFSSITASTAKSAPCSDLNYWETLGNALLYSSMIPLCTLLTLLILSPLIWVIYKMTY